MYPSNRRLIAEEAARLLYEEGYRDYQVAKQKAAQRLGYANDKSHHPSNQEIHEALLSRKELLASDEEKQHLDLLRKIALEAMEFLRAFEPVLTGPVLDGTAGLFTPVTLHLFPDTVEDVMFYLDDQHVPFQSQQRKMRVHGKQDYFPLLRFYADDIEIELLIFDMDRKQAPTSAVTGKAMKRAGMETVRALLGGEQDQSHQSRG